MIIGFTASREAPTERRRACRETRKPKRSVGEPSAKRETSNGTSEKLPQVAIAILAGRRAFRGSQKPKRGSGKPSARRESPNGASESLSRAAIVILAAG